MSARSQSQTLPRTPSRSSFSSDSESSPNFKLPQAIWIPQASSCRSCSGSGLDWTTTGMHTTYQHSRFPQFQNSNLKLSPCAPRGPYSMPQWRPRSQQRHRELCTLKYHVSKLQHTLVTTSARRTRCVRACAPPCVCPGDAGFVVCTTYCWCRRQGGACRPGFLGVAGPTWPAPQYPPRPW